MVVAAISVDERGTVVAWGDVERAANDGNGCLDWR